MLQLLAVFAGTSCAVVDNDGINLLQVQAAANQVNSLDVAEEQRQPPDQRIIQKYCESNRTGSISRWEAAGKCCKSGVMVASGGMRKCRLDTCSKGPAKNTYVQDCMTSVAHPIDFNKLRNPRDVERHCRKNTLVKPNQWVAAGKCCKYGAVRGVPGSMRSCKYDTCQNGPAKDTYVEACMEMMLDKEISEMYVGRGKCVDATGKLFVRAQAVKTQKSTTRLTCGRFFKYVSGKDKQVRAAQWNANTGVCVLYKGYHPVKTTNRDPDYAIFDCFRPVA